MNATSQQMAARRYRIERYLTEGGMGAIYVGKKLGPGGFEKDVVLKQLLPEHTSRPEFRDLFFREAKISATLDHANIVHTFDLVESDESLFIVMEYVRGADLRTICRRAKLRRRHLAPAAAIQIALEILAGLSYAHTRRDSNGNSLDIIHRDVSPSNILCSAEGEVKLSDFGIAKASTHSSVFYRVRGKVGYMSPEQARNQPIDARTDLYSVAVCLYEALTGERLFVGDLSTPPDVIYGQPIAPPSYKRPGLPRALDHVMATALASDPDDRYQDARAFGEVLRQVAHHHGMLSSAPQLAEELRGILGDDPNRWLQEDAEAYPAPPDTQKIQPKALEGKEASSIGVVERSDLYIVSGGDLIGSKSPTVTGARIPSDDLDLDALLALGPRARKDPDSQSAPESRSGASEPPLPISIDDEEDDDVPTSRSNPLGKDGLPGRATPPPRPPASSAGGSGRVVPPPIPGRAAPPPVSARMTAPPPPPRLTPARPPSVVLESPFEEEGDESSEEDAFPFTPVAAAGVVDASLRAAPSSAPHQVPAPLPGAPNRDPQLPRPFPGAPHLTRPFAGAPQLPPPFAGAPHLPPASSHDTSISGRHLPPPGPSLPPPHNGFAAPPRYTPRGGSLLPPAPRLLTLPGAGVHAARGGPHRLVVAAVLAAALLGGAKLASLATSGETARLMRMIDTTGSPESPARAPR